MLPNITDKDLVKFLKQRHPYYLRNESKWAYHEALKSGEVDKSTLLVQGVSECAEEFDLRCNLVEFIPESPAVVDRVVGFLSRNDCDRDAREGADLKGFIEKADNKGKKTLKDIEIGLMEYALYDGVHFLLIDRQPAPADAVITSRADEERLLGSPYAVRYSPRQVTNWKIGGDGYLDWVILREETAVQHTPFERQEIHIVYRYFDRRTWTRFEYIPKKERIDESDKPLRAEEDHTKILIQRTDGEHKLGMVPLVSCAPFKDFDDTAMEGVPFIDPAAKLDKMIFRIESDYYFDQHIHLHPKMVIRTMEKNVIQTMKTTSAITLNPEEKEDAFYVSPPADIFEITRQDIARLRDNVWIQTKQEAANRLTQDRVKEQSGIHKRLSFEMTEGTILSHLSDVLVELDKAILEVVSRYLNPNENPGPRERVFQGEVTRRRNYDIFWINDFLATVNESLPLLSKSPKLMLGILQRVARALLDSPADETIEAISQDLVQSGVLALDSVGQVLAQVEVMKLVEYPAEELYRELYGRIARLLIDETASPDTLQAVLEEIEEAAIETERQGELGTRLNNESQTQFAQTV